MEIVLNNITSTPASFVQIDSSRNTNMVRLIEDPKVEKRIKFDEMSIDDYPNPANVNGDNNKMKELGIVFPMIRINDMILQKGNIKKMIISMSGFMPKIYLTLMFDNTNFISKNPPKDGDIVSVFIRTSTAALTYLRNDFIITNCNVNNKPNGKTGNTVSIDGRLYINFFDSKTSLAAYTGSSKIVLRNIAQDFGIGFAFNDYDDTDDFMTWIQCRETTESFINNVVKHAWKDNTSFFKAWVDLYYNLCYVNVNKFLLTTENEEDVDITFASNIIQLFNLTNEDQSVDNAKSTPKVLSNLSDFMYSPFYIKKWNPINNSTSISMRSGYNKHTFTFVHNQNIINEYQGYCFEELDNIPAYDQNKIETEIILRGRTIYDASTNPDDEMARVNNDYIDSFNIEDWTGVEYVLSDNDDKKNPNEWSGNVHKNYNRATYHNEINLNELNKIYLDVTCTGLNLQIMKGERIPVIIGFNNSVENEQYNNATKNDIPRNLNRFYSGYYIVDSVEYIYKPIPDGDSLSSYETKFILKRREWTTPEIIQNVKDDTMNFASDAVNREN